MEDVEFKYNYVICGSKGFYEIAYYDVMNMKNVKYFSSAFQSLDNKLLKLLARINYSKKINQYISNPFDFCVKNKLFQCQFSQNRPLCFLIFKNNIEVLGISFFQDLKNKYPNSKMVVYFQDIISSYKNFDLEGVRKFADCLVTYDKGDAEMYGMGYFPTPYSIFDIDDNDLLKKSDIYFTGYAKTRYKTIFNVYEKCREQRLLCDFNLVGVPKDQQIYTDEIHYDCPLTYKENLQHVLKTRCILEIMQEGAVGFTPRLWEAIMYDKHLLTNNISVRDTEYYSNRSIHFVGDGLDNISNFIEKDVCNPTSLKKTKSPIYLLKYIESLIS